MKRAPRLLASGLVLAAVVLPHGENSAASKKEARVTRVIREVNLLEGDASRRAATVNDQVTEANALRTGSRSKSELTFPDFTITRLGENSIFSFKSAGRITDLGGGAMLLRVPKGVGGASIRTPAVTVGVTGTTLILESPRNGRSRLLMLEGTSKLTLRKNPRQSATVRGGEMLDVPAGATRLPAVQKIDVAKVMRTHPLIVGFAPLPSQDLIAQTIDEQSGGAAGGPVYQGRPVGGTAGGFTPTFGGFGSVGGGPGPVVPGRPRPGAASGQPNQNAPGQSGAATGPSPRGKKKQKNPNDPP